MEKVLARQVGVVTHHLHFADLCQRRPLLAAQVLGNVGQIKTLARRL
jgi:hypothetical protein